MQAIPSTKLTPDFILESGGQVLCTPAAETLRRAFASARAGMRWLDAACAGAVCGALLTEHPWVSRLVIRFSVSSEFDDEGGSYLATSATVDHVEVVAGAQLPDDCSDDGHLDEDLAVEYLEQVIDRHATELYSGVVLDQDDSGHHTIVIDRSAVREMLCSAEGGISGLALFAALFEDAANELRLRYGDPDAICRDTDDGPAV